MHPVRKPTWQQATALVSLSTCGAMTGFAFAHGTVGEMTSPTRMPVNLMALKKPVRATTAAAGSQSARPLSSSEKAMRAAVVKVARYYLRMAQTKSPAEMEALIWGQNSLDGADHGQSCAAFASLTLALGAQATGQESWVTGGSTYPWPLHQWADVRVDTNSDSPQIISVMQDAQAHQRWHPLGDGYRPQPGDWVLFDGHVEVVTKYSGGALYTIGGDSAPNLSVNAHTFTGPLDAQGVTGFVNNGELLSAVSPAASTPAGGAGAEAQAVTAGIVEQGSPAAGAGGAVVPGTGTATLTSAGKGTTRMVGTAGRTGRAGTAGTAGTAAVPGLTAQMGAASGGTGTGDGGTSQGGSNQGRAAQSRAAQNRAAQNRATQNRATESRATQNRATQNRATEGRAAQNGATQGRAKAAKGRPGLAQGGGAAAIPGLQSVSGGAASPANTASTASSSASPSYTRNNPPASAAHVPDTSSQQAFISAVAPGAMAAQSRYGIPAAVTIAQAIDESGWGQSVLAVRDHNLFGIKGTGPAGSDALPTREYQNGQWVTVTAQFRVYHNVAESIADHSKLLATGPSYQHAMADRHIPDAFATHLTGVYATDPQYGSNLIAIMHLYNLYRYDATTAAAPATPASQPAAVPVAPLPTPSIPAASIPAASIPAASAPAASVPAAPAPSAPASAAPAPTPSAALPSAPSASSTSRSGHGMGGTSNGTRGTATIPGVLDAFANAPSQPTPAAGAVLGTALAGTGLAGARRAGTGRAAAGRSTSGRTGAGLAEAGFDEGGPDEALFGEDGLAGAAARRRAARPAARVAPRRARPVRYVPQLPQAVTAAFNATAKAPLSLAEPLYDEVAEYSGIRWELLAACDWMQCRAQPRFSPVYGEKLGTVNAGRTVYRTKSEALAQCAADLIDLAMAVYWIDITARRPLSVRDLARVFAAFRWGGLLTLHDISAMEFPYSVEGLTAQHVKMRWPDIKDPNAPDKPGTRFRQPFGAVPVVLSLGYPAIA